MLILGLVCFCHHLKLLLLTKQFYFQTPGNKNYLYVSDSYYKVEPFN